MCKICVELNSLQSYLQPSCSALSPSDAQTKGIDPTVSQTAVNFAGKV